MNQKRDVPPRDVPERDFKYMGLAWIHAGFSKDPNTQVGAQLVDDGNMPLGSGYNGPPRLIEDNSFSWARPSGDNDDINKYDVVLHAEHNAIKHSNCESLVNSTLYVTALPCPDCMLEIVEAEIARVVWFNYQSSKNSSLQNAAWREKTNQIAQLGGIHLEEFRGSIAWVADWTERMKQLGVFGM